MKRFLAFLALTAFVLSGLFLGSCDQDESAFRPEDENAFTSDVSGRLTDRQGRALGGVLVTALPVGVTTLSGSDGTFRLSGLVAGSYRVTAARDEYRDTMWLDSVRMGLAAVQPLGTLAMRYRYATAKGVVVDSDGVVRADAGISIESQTATTTSGKDGKFTLARVEPGRVRLFAAIQGLGYGFLDTVLAADDTLQGVRLRIDHRGGVVVGKVVGRDGKAVSGAVVRTVGGALEVVTDADGMFRLADVPSEGAVVVEIAKDGLSTTITGVRVAAGARTDLSTIVISASSTASVFVRSGFAIAMTTDSVVTLMAETVSNDTTFRVLRHLWSVDGGRSWDTTSVNVSTVRPKSLGWAIGTHPVLVKVVSVDGRISSTGTISVRLAPPPDWIAPTASRRSPKRDTTYAWRDSVATVSWSVSDDRRLDSVKIDTFLVEVDGGVAAQVLTLPVGTTIVRLWARDSAGNTVRDSLQLTREVRPDTTPPTVALRAPKSDTSYVWRDSVVTVSWSVSDDRRLDSVKIDTFLVEVDSGIAKRRIVLPVGATVVRLWARDSAGNTACDSIVLARQEHADTSSPEVVRRAPKSDTSYVWRDSIVTVSWSVSDNRRLDSVKIDTFLVKVDSGIAKRKIVLPVGTTVVRLWARDSTGNTTRDSLKLTRKARSDTSSPTVVRRTPKSDTSYVWKDSVVTVSWSVSDDRRLDSVKIDTFPVVVDSGVAKRRIVLPVGTTVVRLWARDSAGNTTCDSLELIRETMPAYDSCLRFLEVGAGILSPAFRSDSLSYRDTVLAEDTAILIHAVPMDTVAGVVAIDGYDGRSRFVRLGSDGTATRIRVVSRGGDNDSLVYVVDVYREPDLAFGAPWNSTVPYGTLHDERDGKKYRTVKIGDQTWMAENLAYVVDSSWCPEGRSDSCAKYGRLYQWAAAMAIAPTYDAMAWDGGDSLIQGVCPRGWHLPSETEWTALTATVEADARVGEGFAGSALKSTAGWYLSGNGTDRFGFRAIPAGYRYNGDGPLGMYAHFWSASAYNGETAWLRTAYHNYARMYGGSADKKAGYAVRCLEDPVDTSTSLKALSVGAGSLSPAFLPSRLAYVDSVSARIGTLSVAATSASKSATVTIDGGGTVSLATDSVIEVKVANGAGSRTYSIRVFHRLHDSTYRVPLNGAIPHGVLRDARDGQEYRTVRIGDQNWMAENLNRAVDSSWCVGDDEDSCGKYGRQYQWSSAMDISSANNTSSWTGSDSSREGVCPSGWHLPSDADWSILANTVQADSKVGANSAGGALKAASGWSNSGNGTDLFGYRVLPGGYRYSGASLSVGDNARFWTATQSSVVAAGALLFLGSSASIGGGGTSKTLGMSVRCLENASDTSTALASLTVGQGSLSPAFLSTRTQYVDTVGARASILVVAAVALSKNATVTIDDGGTVSLATDSVIEVKVANGAGSRIYAIRVFHRAVVDTTWGVPWNASLSYGVLRDARDGQEYRTIRIGDRNWMAENLNKAADSSWCVGGSDDSCDKYGRLYQWPAAMGLSSAYGGTSWSGGDSLRQGICPSGWHLPNDTDWAYLQRDVEFDSRVGSGSGGSALKTGPGWNGSSGGSDLFGFRGIPGGYRYSGADYAIGSYARYWSASQYSATYADSRMLYYASAVFGTTPSSKILGMSVRCVEDPLDTSTALASLSVGRGFLAPAFLASRLAYDDTVGPSVATLSVTATALSGKATVTIDGGGTVSLATDSVIDVTVVNGAGSRTYTIRVLHTDSTWGVPWSGNVPYGVLHDARDGNEYRTVRIGDQNWMAENLKHEGPDSTWCYGGRADSCDKYGRLYSWTSALEFASVYDVVGWNGSDSLLQGECPTGWHLPNDAEWGTLVKTVEADARVGSGGANAALKSAKGWNTAGNGMDLFGFRILPAGVHNYDARMEYGAGDHSDLWSASVDVPTSRTGFQTFASSGATRLETLADAMRKYGRSIRCLENPADTSTSLRSLVVGQGALSADFLPTRLAYVDSVDPEIATFSVAAQPASAKAVVTIDGGGTVSLATDSVIDVKVVNGAGSRTYSIRVFHRAIVDTTYGVAWNASVSYGVLHDSRDNKEYRTVRIGDRNWMAENLNHAVDSSWCHAGNSDSCGKYGRRYQWSAAMDLSPAYNTKKWGGDDEARRGVCPSGWHLPGDAEWTSLANAVASDAGIALRSASGWSYPGTDQYGFRGLSAGYKYGDSYDGITNAYFWSASEPDSVSAWTRLLVGNDLTLLRIDLVKTNGFSVRCVEDPPDTSTRLRSLNVALGTLSPAFHRDIVSYVDSVESDVATLSLTAVAASGNASVTIDGGGTVALGTDSVIQIDVVNGHGHRVYEIRVVHKAPAADTTYGVAWNASVSYGVLHDARDGQEYRTVAIGGKTWMAENLNYSADSSWCAVDSCAKYGRLYSWIAAMGLSSLYDNEWWLGSSTLRQGACPTGWHVPKDTEWVALEAAVEAGATTAADSAGAALQSAGWLGSSYGMDSFGFRALPAGYRAPDNQLVRAAVAEFWSSSQYEWSGQPAWFRYIRSSNASMLSSLASKNYGFSLRCVEN